MHPINGFDRPSRQCLAWFSAALCVCLLAGATARAQNAGATAYKELPYDEGLKGKLEIMVRKVLSGSLPLEENVAEFDQYFTGYIIPALTLESNRTQLPKLRQLFTRQALRAAKDPKVHEHLNKLTLDTMKLIVADRGGPFHPAVRYCAMLIIGDLDFRLAVEGVTNRAPPLPLPEALDVLLIGAASPQLPDYIHAGAMVGLVRHAKYRMTGDNRDRVNDVLLKILGEKKAPKGRDVDVHTWMRRSAAEGLSTLPQPSGSDRVPKALENVLADPGEPLALRCAAARALGTVQVDGGLPLDPEKYATALGELALAVFQFEQPKVERRGALNSRRQVAYLVGQIRDGLEPPVTSDPNQKIVAAVAKSVDDLLAAISPAGTDTITIQDSLSKEAQTLQVVLGKTPAATEAPAKTAAEPEPAAKTQTAPKPKKKKPVNVFE